MWGHQCAGVRYAGSLQLMMHRSLFQPLTNMSGSDTTYPSNSGPFFIGISCGDWLRLAWKRYQLVLEMMRDEPNEDYSELLTESWAEILYVLEVRRSVPPPPPPPPPPPCPAAPPSSPRTELSAKTVVERSDSTT